MIERRIKKVMLSRLDHFPAAALLGPRQSGKTTLAKTLSTLYYDLEVNAGKMNVEVHWDHIIEDEHLIVLDEAHGYPEIFPRIRNAIDQDRKRNGRFLILGSASPALMTQVSQALTGRIALCELSPLSITEVETSEDHAWLVGGFPDGGILNGGDFPVWQQNYLDLIAMRDLPNWGSPAKQQTTKKLFKMLAESHGNIWNANQIGKSMGISYHTVNKYLDYLEQLYLIRRLQAYSERVSKRLIKRPKVYWRDTGLLHSLLGAGSIDDLLCKPWVGSSWEGWVIEQILEFLDICGVQYDAYHFRTSDNYELALVLKAFGKTWAFQTKLSSSPSMQDLNRLKKTVKLIGADIMVLVSKIKDGIETQDILSTNIRGILRFIEHFV